MVEIPLKRDQILRHATQPIEITPDKTVSDLVADLSLLGFQGRKLGEAAEVWTRMLKKKDNLIWFGLAGAMIPAGLRKLLSYLIRRRMIDCLVSTGANLYHDTYEAFGGHHFQGSEKVDDVELRRHRIDRMYDVYSDEKKFYWLDVLIEKQFCATLEDDFPYSSRQIVYELGSWLKDKVRDKESIVVSAAEAKIPVFVPALADSSLGFAIMFANRRRGRRIIIDHMRDVDESSRITEKAKNSGVIIVGGGTPKNFIQQTAVIASYQTRHDRTHGFAIQFSTDVPQWGGLSGSTFEEAQSWGKYKPRASLVSCHVDATIALPIVVQALAQRFKRLTRNVPVFNWNSNNLTIRFEKQRL